MKLTLQVVSIRLRGSIHLGEGENGLETSSALPHSDTLFSAFCHGFRLLYGKSELDQLLNTFMTDSPPFRISSAFPQWEGTFYFPVPLNQLVREKEFKKIGWIEQKGWEKLLAGAQLGDMVGQFKCLPPVDQEKQKEIKQKPSLPWRTQGVPRIGLNRLTNHPDERYFHFAQVHFDSEASFFFLVHLQDESVRVKFQATWRLLADEGLGGDRSVGKGLFETPQFDTLILNVPDRANARTVLSLFYPAEGERGVLQDGWYEFIERKGYIFSADIQSLRRQGVRFFREGSVFGSNKTLVGTLVDVTPQTFTPHKIYRCGVALSVPCQDNGGHHVG